MSALRSQQEAKRIRLAEGPNRRAVTFHGLSSGLEVDVWWRTQSESNLSQQKNSLVTGKNRVSRRTSLSQRLRRPFNQQIQCRSPATAIEPAGQDLGAPLAPGNWRQYRSNRSGLPAISRQCSCAVRQRLIAGSRRTGSDAGSGSPRRALLLRRRDARACNIGAVTETGSIELPDWHGEISWFFATNAELAGCLARFCLCNGVLEPSKPFRPLCLWPQYSVSRQRRLRFEETCLRSSRAAGRRCSVM
jgi:hypothetical protein